MRAKRYIATFLFFFFVYVVNAQTDALHSRMDSLANETAALDKVVRKLSQFKVSGYIQGQYQYGQEKATLKVGDKNENTDEGFNRMGIRRGRIKFEYNDGLGMGAVQLEVNDKGVDFRDLYLGLKDPWTKRSGFQFGFFSVPFGYEVCYSTGRLESPERATIIQTFFPDERDLGGMISLRTPKATDPLHFLSLDFGLFAGNAIHAETDNRKNFIGRLGAEDSFGNGGEWGAGFSYYNGSVYNPTTEVYTLDGKQFVKSEKEKPGTYLKREYFGLDAHISFISSFGKTTLRAEGLIGTQPGTAGSSKSPNAGTRPENLPENALYKRPVLGYFFYLIQDIGETPFSTVLKYDAYDPNTKIEKEEIGASGSYATRTDLAQNTWGLGALYRFSKNIRLQAYYEINTNEKSSFVEGYEKDRKDNVFTLRLQYLF